MQSFLWALGGTGFIFLMTCLGSGTVFLFRKPSGKQLQKAFLGFAAGVMVAASIWSLLIPAIEEAQAGGLAGWIPAAVGVAAGALFMLLLDRAIPHLHIQTGAADGPPAAAAKRSTMLLLAVTIHNIPEGMAVGLSFALAAQHPGDPAMYAAAAALALGIGIQNFPEGSAISLPLWQEGMSKRKAFLSGCISGAVEPIFGLLTALLAGFIAPLMPWLLSFAAGSMLYVVVEELIPEVHEGPRSHLGTMSVLGGFLIMMVLDVALG